VPAVFSPAARIIAVGPAGKGVHPVKKQPFKYNMNVKIEQMDVLVLCLLFFMQRESLRI